jgi:hypothetical protein
MTRTTHRDRSVRIAVAISTLLLLHCSAFGQLYLEGKTAPGAIERDGSFSIISNHTTAMYVRSWDNQSGTWKPTGFGLFSGILGLSPPASNLSDGGFFVTVRRPWINERPFLAKWVPNGSLGQLTFFGAPPGRPSTMSGPSEVMYGNRVFVAAGGVLYERFLWGPVDWHSHGMAFGSKPLRDVTPCVFRDGSIFATTTGGELVQLWWNAGNQTWNWYGHGHPERYSIFGGGGVSAISVGAAMPGSGKVFVTCSDGSLRQVYHDGTTWRWHNHGTPFGWRVDSRAVAILDGKLFVTGRWDSGGTIHRTLLELYWNGSAWIWYDHGTPPGTGLESGAATTMGGDFVAVMGTNGRYYLRDWDPATGNWRWKDCGR